jgi:hypothetical protein
MKRKIILKKYVSLHRGGIIAITAGLFIFVIALCFSSRLMSFCGASSIEKQMTRIEQGLQRELGYISEQRKAIIASEILNDALKKNDAPQILGLIQAEAEKRNVDCIIVTDKHGFVLARSNLPLQYGDNIFQTIVYGKKISQGEAVAAVDRTTRSPLSSISGSLIAEDNDTAGSIIISHVFNDSYAECLREKYLKPGAEIVFYASPEGVVGSSSDNKQTTQLINAYFSLGSDLVAQNFAGLSKEIKINGSYYAVRHIVFPGIEESPGGAFILLPVNHGFYGFVLAGCITILFFVLCFLPFFAKTNHRKKKTRRRKRSVPLFLLAGLALFIAAYAATVIKLDRASIELKESPYLIYNSVIKFVPETDIIRQFSEKTVAVRVFTGGEAINAISAVIRYDPRKVEVLDILTENSLCDPSFFLEKEIDRQNGLVTIACVVPSPGFSDPAGTVAELLMRPLTAGDASLEFAEETQVLANDGLGTSVLRTAADGCYQVMPQTFPAAGIRDPVPIFSPSHPNSGRWYRKKQIELLWPPIEGAVYRYAFNRGSDPAPQDMTSTTTDSSLNFSVDEDGVYYFCLQAEDARGNRGPVSRFKIMIDATPPLPPEILTSSQEVKRDEIVRLDFTAKDALSGLQSGFFVKINEGIFLPVKPPFYIPFLDCGEYFFVIRAFDKANNFSDSGVVIRVTD